MASVGAAPDCGTGLAVSAGGGELQEGTMPGATATLCTGMPHTMPRGSCPGSCGMHAFMFMPICMNPAPLAAPPHCAAAAAPAPWACAEPWGMFVAIMGMGMPMGPMAMFMCMEAGCMARHPARCWLPWPLLPAAAHGSELQSAALAAAAMLRSLVQARTA